MPTLMAIGGALDQETPSLMKEFVRRAGGDQSNVLVLPQASDQDETGEIYAGFFRDLNVKQVSILDFHQRLQPVKDDQIKQIRNATGIFFTGGAQLRLSVLFGGTRIEKELHAAFNNGCLVGGTSAGASIISKIMMAAGHNGPTPRGGIVQFSPGLGFTDRLIFDQHFRQRDRLGRLIYAVTSYPGVAGVGIDENTAALLEDDDLLTVYGTGAVTIVDGGQISATDLPEVTRRVPISVTGLTVHVLTEGGTYRCSTHTAALPPKKNI